MLRIGRNWSSAAVVVLLGVSSALANCNWDQNNFGGFEDQLTDDLYIDSLRSRLVCTGYTNIGFIITLNTFDSFELVLDKIENGQSTVINLVKAFVDGDIEEYEDVYSNIKNYNLIGKEIEKLTITDSRLTEMPSGLYTLPGLKVAMIRGNNIKSINLNMLPYAKNLKILDLSNNGINEFEEETVTYKSTKYLESIKLSYNKLDRIPLNCFYSTRDSITNLDLSYNAISNIDYYSFANLAHLDSLDLSNNQLVSLGCFLYPLRSLRSFNVSRNKIKVMLEENFNKSTNLVNLDVSFNSIEALEDRVFGNLKNLGKVDLSFNKIQTFDEILLRNNTKLTKLSLAFNNLNKIEPGIFTELEDLHEIDLRAALATELTTHMFMGLKAEILNLTGSKINKIVGTPFTNMGNYLKDLDLHSCEIQIISESAFDTLTELNRLDLSSNKLLDLDFLKVDLANLSTLYLQNNSIQELKSDTFQTLSSLTVLDLSSNDIKSIPPMAFKNLKNLVFLNIVNNKLSNTLLSNTFFGLDSVQDLELTNTKYMRWDSYALTGLKNLNVLNASHGELVFIDYYAFTGINNVQTLDLSFNQLQNFNIKLLHNKYIREIYLNNNELSSLLMSSFDGLDNLEVLNLSNNKITKVGTFAFQSLKALRYLDMSNNSNIELTSNAFDNLILTTLLLKKINNKVSYQFENATITNLDISSNQITNISSLHLENIKNLVSLDLSNNNIASLDKYSFENGFSIKVLNLSHNKINHVHPGAFINTSDIRELDLSYNNLERVQFGALRGLYDIKKLDLSNNELSEYKLALLYDVPTVSTLILDDNKIYDLALATNLYNLKRLSLGGNSILCEQLVLIQSKYKIILDTRSLDYFTENVSGVSCKPYTLGTIASTEQSFLESSIE